MRRFTIRLVAMVVLSLGSVAVAGLGPNGLGPNGLGPNGLGPNGLGPNGLGPNGLGPNGLGPNGLGPNGLGPNGLGPNGLGPNGLDVNGLGPNGLGPNGLGPNGLIYLVTPDGWTTTQTSEFKSWFKADPASAAQYMRYFVRCAYDASTGLAYVDDTGKTWLWTGQYGFAMTSLKNPTLVPLSPLDPKGPLVRSRMTVDEGRWVSSCLLAHVNLQGSHQYLSIRGTPPNLEAAAALKPGINEQWIMGQKRFGAFFGDLFTSTPKKYACTQENHLNDFYRQADVAIGRNCDVGDCKYVANGVSQSVLTAHLGSCWIQDLPPWPAQYLHWRWSAKSQDPYFPYLESGVTYEPPVTVKVTIPVLHPLYVSGPLMVSATQGVPYTFSSDYPGSYNGNQAPFYRADVARCAATGGAGDRSSCIPANDSGLTVPIVWGTNGAVCGGVYKCLGSYPITPDYTPAPESYKLANLGPGQAFDIGVRFTPEALRASSGNQGTLAPDMSEAFTAIIRYSKSRAGAANLWVTNKDGSWRRATELTGGPGPDVWPATGADTWDWMQVYPAYLNFDKQGSTTPGRYCASTSDCWQNFGLTCDAASLCSKPVTTVNAMPWCDDYGFLKLAGNTCVQMCYADSECGRGATCTAGQCVAPAVKVRISGATQGTTCTGTKLARGDGEANTCSSWTYDALRNRYTCVKRAEGLPRCRGVLAYSTKGWRCTEGGAALMQCLAADAPDLDAVGFVPGKPWCMAAGATTFVGACR